MPRESPSDYATDPKLITNHPNELNVLNDSNVLTSEPLTPCDSNHLILTCGFCFATPSIYSCVAQGAVLKHRNWFLMEE